MNYLTLIATVSLLNLLGAISPGPDFVMAVKNSLNYSRRTGIYTAVGIGLGIAVHITYCAAGIGFIISRSIWFFSIIKYMGAGYLIYMGIMAWFAKGSRLEVEENHVFTDLTPLQAVRTGFFTNVLNPKATLFFLGLFSLVINHETPFLVIVLLAFIMVATAMIWFSLVAVFFTQKKVQQTFLRFEKGFNKVFGSMLILLGIKIAASSLK